VNVPGVQVVANLTDGTCRATGSWTNAGERMQAIRRTSPSEDSATRSIAVLKSAAGHSRKLAGTPKKSPLLPKAEIKIGGPNFRE
jgi:hypothetical protein